MKHLRKRITLLLIALLLLLSSVSALIYWNSTFYKVKRIEKAWGIDLPLPAQKIYAASETFIDGSVNYLVFTLFYEPDDDFFTKHNTLITNENFTLWFNEALDTLTNSDGSAKVLDTYKPNFNDEYEYMFLSRPQRNRTAYFYGVFVATSLTMYVCSEVRQYAH